ncbi:AAEL004304-PA, partial [Aedes aegypti]
PQKSQKKKGFAVLLNGISRSACSFLQGTTPTITGPRIVLGFGTASLFRLFKYISIEASRRLSRSEHLSF